MKTIIRKTKEQAIEAANDLLCEKLGCDKLAWSLVKDSYCECECGQTYAIELKGCDGKDNYDSVIVGVCGICGE